MKIKEKRVTVRDVTNGYVDDGDEGVRGYGGRLDIRPAYQRGFVYKDKQRDEVVRTIMRGLPLNVMYWCPADGGWEILDGQQRTMSISKYVHGDFSIDARSDGLDGTYYFGNLPQDVQERILNYRLFVYVCDGEDSEKLEWFRIINTAGEPLTAQELRNAVYMGSWVSDAKRRFSSPGCPAKGLAGDYLSGKMNRQEWLETAIKWAADPAGETIDRHMAVHQHDANAVALWNHFRSVIDWVQAIFPKTRPQMKGLDWGRLYEENKDRVDLDPKALEAKTRELVADPDVTRKNGIYEYLLDGQEKHLNIRAFDKRVVAETYEKQDHKCAICGKECALKDMQADHIVPWSRGGRTVPGNCQMLCVKCNLSKSDKNE